MTYISYIPSPPLNAYIEDLYYLDGPSSYPRQKVLPVASSNLMINLGDHFDVYEPDQARPFITCTDSWWVGIWTTYHSVDWPARVKFFGVHFKPGGAYPFLQLPLSEMNSQVVPLDAVWGLAAGDIRKRLQAAATVKARFALLEQLLMDRFREAPYSLNVVQHAVVEIAQHHGALSIRALSDQVGFSQNHLGNQFKRFVGIPPKEVARFYLIHMQPRGDLTSTGFALANPAKEYLVLNANAASDPFTVTVEAGDYEVEWFHVNRCETNDGKNMTVMNDGENHFLAPFAQEGPVLLYLKRVGH